MPSGLLSRTATPVARSGGRSALTRTPRLSTTLVGDRADAIAAAFAMEAPSPLAGGVWRWDVASDRLWFSAGAIRLVADCCGEVSTRAPVFLSHMSVWDRQVVLLALAGALSRSKPIDVEVYLGEHPRGARVRLRARPMPTDRHSLIGSLQVA